MLSYHEVISQLVLITDHKKNVLLVLHLRLPCYLSLHIWLHLDLHLMWVYS
jgi:hypothetical protein